MAAPDRSTCEIHSWPIFAPGVFKQSGEYFSPADVRKIADNFASYSTGDNPPLRPLIKIGHHRDQRYAQSLGFPSLGQITDAHLDDANHALVIDRAAGIPRIIGSAINSGRLVSGSVELPPKGVWRPPNDPNAKIDGDIMSGVALLGEEMPGVPGFARPHAVFADGTPVPPLTDEEEIWWLEHMAPVLGELNEPSSNKAGNDAGQDYSCRLLCFSALTYSAEKPVDPMQEKLLALGLTPEQIEGVLAVFATPEPAVADLPAAPDAAAIPPEVQMSGTTQNAKQDEGMNEQFAAFAADCKKMFGAMETRMSAIEAAESAKKDKDKEETMAAFGAMADQVVARSMKKAGPERLKVSKELLLKELATGTFASADARQQCFASWAQGWDAMPESPAFAHQVQTNPEPGKVQLSTVGGSIINSEHFQRTNPRLAAKLREKAIVRA